MVFVDNLPLSSSITGGKNKLDIQNNMDLFIYMANGQAAGGIKVSNIFSKPKSEITPFFEK